MHIELQLPPGTHFETGTCPNEGHPCNCLGVCRVEIVKDEHCKCDGTGKVKREYHPVTSFKVFEE